MARSKSSSRWLQEHHKDQFVKQARKDSYRARSAYKLLEIQKRDQIIRKNMRIADLGAAPGAWSQVCLEIMQNSGEIYAMDILSMQELPGVTFLQGDFTDYAIHQQLYQLIGEQRLDLVISDIAPNMSGIKSVDQDRSIYLLELVTDFASKQLKADGDLLMKAFHGAGMDSLIKTLRQNFAQVVTRKPDSSRARSREIYLLARGHKCK